MFAPVLSLGRETTGLAGGYDWEVTSQCRRGYSAAGFQGDLAHVDLLQGALRHGGVVALAAVGVSGPNIVRYHLRHEDGGHQIGRGVATQPALGVSLLHGLRLLLHDIFQAADGPPYHSRVAARASKHLCSAAVAPCPRSGMGRMPAPQGVMATGYPGRYRAGTPRSSSAAPRPCAPWRARCRPRDRRSRTQSL